MPRATNNGGPRGEGVGDALKPCPFCGGEAKRFTIEEPGDNFGGDVIACTGKCGASSHVEFGRKENLVSLWNHRITQPHRRQLMTTPATEMEIEPMVERVARAICGRDIEWRDCERACLAAGRCVGNLSECVIEDARAAIAAYEATRTPEAAQVVREAAEPWADYHGDIPDYDHPLRPVFESGIQYAVELLAKMLGVDDWEICDGTEEFDGDLGGTLLNIVIKTWPTDEHGDWIDLRDPETRAALAQVRHPSGEQS